MADPAVEAPVPPADPPAPEAAAESIAPVEPPAPAAEPSPAVDDAPAPVPDPPAPAPAAEEPAAVTVQEPPPPAEEESAGELPPPGPPAEPPPGTYAKVGHSGSTNASVAPGGRYQLKALDDDLAASVDWATYKPLGAEGAAAQREQAQVAHRRPAKSTVDDVGPLRYGKAYKPKKSGGKQPAAQREAPPAEWDEEPVNYRGPMRLDTPEDASEQAAERRGVEHYKALARRLKHELITLRHRAEQQLDIQDAKISRLHKTASSQRDVIETQAAKIRELENALEEVRRESMAEHRELHRVEARTEARLADMHRQLGAAAAEHERALAGAAGELDSLQKERDTLAEAMSLIATTAVGGANADPGTIAAEAEAALAEGADPLPRRPEAWAHLSYGGGGAAGAAAPAARGRSQPFGGDGQRAVAALVATVQRLHRQREEAKEEAGEAGEQVEQLRDIIGRVDSEYQAVADMVEAVESEMRKVQQQRNIPSLPQSQVQKGLAGRVGAVYQLLGRLSVQLDLRDQEKAKMQAQLLELDFYSKLHAKVVEQAKAQTAEYGIAQAEPAKEETAVVPAAES